MGNMTSRVLVLAATLVLTPALSSACSGSASAGRSAPPETVLGTRSRTTSDSIDTYRPSAQEFFSRFRLPGAIYLAPPRSLAEASRSARAVVVARVLDVRESRIVRGDSASDNVLVVALVLEAVEVLKGKLDDQTRTLSIDFPVATGDPTSFPEAVAQFRQELPVGLSVWFVRHAGDPLPGMKAKSPEPASDTPGQYTLLSLEGVFVQGPTSVIAAMVDEPGAGYLGADGQRYAHLSELVEHVRRS